MLNRIDRIRLMLSEQPQDPFLRYALAQELCNAGDLVAGVQAFEDLRRDNPEYVGLYYQLGLALLQLERPEEADAVFAEGIARADTAGDSHTAQTMRNARLNASLE